MLDIDQYQLSLSLKASITLIPYSYINKGEHCQSKYLLLHGLFGSCDSEYQTQIKKPDLATLHYLLRQHIRHRLALQDAFGNEL